MIHLLGHEEVHFYCCTMHVLYYSVHMFFMHVLIQVLLMPRIVYITNNDAIINTSYILDKDIDPLLTKAFGVLSNNNIIIIISRINKYIFGSK